MRNRLCQIIAAALFAAAVPCAAGPAAAAGDEQTSTSLPAPLSEADAERYRLIFALQEDGKWRAADKEIARLDDPILLGHVQAQRYLHPTRYRSHFRELAKWLASYADLPEARRIYELALRRRPKHAAMPHAPALPPVFTESDSAESPDDRPSLSHRGHIIERRIRSLVRRRRLTVAEDYLERPDVRRQLQPYEMSNLVGRIASGWYYFGNDEKALANADRATASPNIRAVRAHWYGGLAAFRMGRYDEAAAHFEALAAIPDLSSWSRSAAGFWAARANLVGRHPDRVSRLLRVAAEESRTFYGLLARRVLGLDSPFDWSRPSFSPADIAAVMSSKRARRALALLQIDETDRAETELRYLARTANPAIRRALLALADELGLSSLAFNTAARLNETEGRVVERGLYPVPRWTPRDGFIVDRALIFAIIRQESAFNVHAKSPAGARGLMQLMPGTAGYMAKRRFRGSRRMQLYDPTLNLTLGQKYLRYLLQHEMVQGDMFRLAAAYNGGPGNLAKWEQHVNRLSHDPLLFIESLPSRETRNFIERVLANFWLYRERLGQPSPSLDAVAAGEAPAYHSLDRALVAETPPDGRN